jgi:esterase/lipase superfamily enzyme
LVLYVHGCHNTFGDAAMPAGELCHFLGRQFACDIFTWLAGGKLGVLAGYNVDYESSVFATDACGRRCARLPRPRASRSSICSHPAVGPTFWLPRCLI